MLEKDFVRSLRRKLKNENAVSYCIETGLTCKGFPDLYVLTLDDDFLIEVKVVNKPLPAKEVTIPWRAGQQAWALNYAARHHRRKHTWTFVKFEDRYVLIKMSTLWDKNKINLVHKDVHVLTESDWHKFKISPFLLLWS